MPVAKREKKYFWNSSLNKGRKMTFTLLPTTREAGYRTGKCKESDGLDGIDSKFGVN